MQLETMMKSTQLEETDHGVVIEVYVKPNSKQFQVKAEDDRLVVFCKESPVKGRANKELTRELSSLFKRRVEIISGHRSKQKRILIRDSNAREVRGILRAHFDFGMLHRKMTERKIGYSLEV